VGLSSSDFFRTRGFFICGRPHFFVQKHRVFWKLWCVCTDKGSWASANILWTRGEGVNFSQFFADVLYGRSLIVKAFVWYFIATKRHFTTWHSFVVLLFFHKIFFRNYRRKVFNIKKTFEHKYLPCICEISHSRGNRTPNYGLQSSTTSLSIRKRFFHKSYPNAVIVKSQM